MAKENEQNESQAVAKKRDMFLNRMKSKYPDRNFDDEEVLFGQINDDYDGYDKTTADLSAENEEYKKREKALGDMFVGDPRKAKFMTDMRDGVDPAISLLRLFGDDITDIINDPAKQEEVAAANKEYADRITEEKNYEQEYAKNLDASLAYAQQLQDKGVPEEKVDAAFALLLKIAQDGLKGIFAPESFELAMKANGYDKDVQAAGEDGEVRGRNAKIDEKLRKSKRGDGLAPLAGQNGAPASDMPKRDLGALNRYDEGLQNIWERGGERRTKY